MNEMQEAVLTRTIGNILKFYQYGRDGAPNPPTLGGFADLFAKNYPDSFEENKEFIFLIDTLVVAAYNAGKKR